MVGVKEQLRGVVYPSAEDLERYAALGLFTGETMAEAFAAVARRFPDRPALSDVEGHLTFAELDELTDRLAAGLLDIGLRPLDRACFQVANGRHLVVSFLACLKAGIVAICTLPAHRKAEIGYLARHAGAVAHFIHTDDPKFDFAAFSREVRQEAPSLRLSIVARGPAPGGDPSFATIDALAARFSAAAARERLAGVPRDPCQVAVFQLSGGTSGVPKIIPRFHNEYLYQLRTVAAWQGLDETTVAYTPAPMLHNAPIVCYWGLVLWSGGEVACASSLDPAAIAAVIAARRPNWMSIPLPLLLNLRNAGLLDRDLFRGARMVTSGHTARVCELTGAVALPLYGMTEGIISFGRPDDPPSVLQRTVGRPVSPHDHFRIVHPETREPLEIGELGEFCFKGPTSCRGYFDAEERSRDAFTSDGFCLSGDLMRIHEIEGRRYVSFEGRVKDVVSRGGEKINCEEVERVLIGHPAVGAVAIVPMPDPVYGERACAFIIPKRGSIAPTVAEAGRFLEAAGLAKFKWPERIEPVAEFPTTSSGKISKPLMREMIARILAEHAERAGESSMERSSSSATDRPAGQEANSARPRSEAASVHGEGSPMEPSSLSQREESAAAPETLRYRSERIDVGQLKPAALDGIQLRLHGVDHTARPTWRLRETVTFYRDILGLPLIHTISARGWGTEGHPDFLHFFFDAGNGATIAFFYYLGTDQPEKYAPAEHPFSTATHTAWGVETMEELQLWKKTLEARGITVSNFTRHEALESIYFRDPNGYPVEITLRLRDVHQVDAKDAEMTLEAAMQLEDETRAASERLTEIDTVWRRKARLVSDYLEA